MKINSITVCKLIQNRFKRLKESFCEVKWVNERVENTTSTVPTFDRLLEGHFTTPNDKFHGVNIQGFNSSSTETSVFFVSDLPISQFSSEFLTEIAESSAVTEFCKSRFIISFLDLIWFRWARAYFFKGNLLYLVYFLLLAINSLYLLPNFIIAKENGFENNYWLPFLICSVILSLLVGYMFWREFNQWYEDKAGYFDSIWNCIDTTNIVMNIASIILNILAIFDVLETCSVPKLFNSICFFLAVIRTFDFFRAFKQTCFLIEIILQVLRDMKSFFFLMILLLANFSCSGIFL